MRRSVLREGRSTTSSSRGDFFCPAHRLIVEIDGGQHFEDAGLAADLQRTRWLVGEGYRVLRFTNLDVLNNIDGVCRVIVEATAPGRPST